MSQNRNDRRYTDPRPAYDHERRRQSDFSRERRPNGRAYAANASARGRSSGAARRSANARPRRKTRRSGFNPLKLLGFILVALFGIISYIPRKLSKLCDRFRRDALSSTLVDVLLGGFWIVLICSVLLLFKDDISLMRVKALASSKPAAAERMLENLQDRISDEQLDEARYKIVRGYIDSDKPSDALVLLTCMDDSDENARMRNLANYTQANIEYEDKDYSRAAQSFYQLGDYADSATLYLKSCCAQAIVDYQSGDQASAGQILAAADGAENVIAEVALDVTQDEAQAQAILSDSFFSAANLVSLREEMSRLTGARDSIASNRVAAGKYHTVILNQDGTVRSVGDNSFGQCDTAGWSGITAVVAGAYHTVGLKSDGTVVATGNNSAQQCEVSTWTDIRSIAAASYATLGLRSDGTVVACGMNVDAVTGWHDVKRIVAGGYCAACLYGNNAMLATHEGAQLGVGTTLYDLSVCGCVSVGLMYDGTIQSSFDDIPAWQDVASVRVSETAAYAIDTLGNVLTYDYHTRQEGYITMSSPAIEIECSGTHYVILSEDGSVSAYGSNDYGECSVS